jgi:hypothetical protein
MGLSARGGWNAPPILDWAGLSSENSFLFLVIGTEGEWVLRDLFLDGSTWGASPHVSRVPLVGRIKGRLQVGGPHFGIEIAATRASRQFTGQDGSHTVATFRLIIRP